MASPFNPRDVEVLAAALPAEGANPVGSATRGLLTVHVKRATPGNYSQLIGTGPAFRAIFFPGTGESPYESQITPLTGLDSAFFASMAIAMVCQEIHQVTSRLRPQMMDGEIASALRDLNSGLRQNSYRLYAFMAGVADSPIRAALATFGDEPARAQARAHYLAGISSPTWVNDKMVQDASHNWPDRDWELFHHWIKLTALGASVSEINQAIATAIGLGLPVPASLRPGAWHLQSPWFGPDIGGGDAADAASPILATRCHAVPGSAYPSCMAEDNAFEFTANSQPGNRYRRPPSGSCLAPGTRVVMADGSLRPIERIGPGDVVATPDGGKPVVLRSAPLRGGRTLERFTGTRIVFAASQPFLVHGGPDPAAATYAAADPAALARSVPTLSQFGISSLRAPVRPVLTRYTPDGGVPYPAPPVTGDPDRQPELLYDLYLEVGADGRSEFYAGDDSVQVLVSSEAPRFEAAPGTAEVVLHVLEHAGPTVLAALADVPDASFEDLLSVGLDSLAATLMPAIGPRLAGPGRPAAGEETAAAQDPPAARDPAARGPAGLDAAQAAERLAAAVRGYAAGMAQGDPGLGRRMGVLVEQFCARFAPMFQAVLALPWRSFDLAEDDVANLLAVTLYSVELFQPGPQPPSRTEVEIALTRGASRYRRVLPAQPGAPADRWYYCVDAPAYFPEWVPPGSRALVWRPPGDGAGAADPAEDMLWGLEIGLIPDAGVRAWLPLPRELAHGYQMFGVPVTDASGADAGQVLCDARLLTTETLAAELRARRHHQGAGGDRGLAHRLAELASEYISKSFAVAVAQFRFCAATTTTP
jgi:hypothetical protein